MSFDTAVGFILRPDIEGGAVNNPADKGGSTFRGITQWLFNSWLTHQALPLKSVIDATLDEIRDVYFEIFWKPIKGDSLPAPLDMAVFDGAVQCGVSTSVKMLQSVLGVTADGLIGPNTLAIVKSKDLKTLCDTIISARKMHYDAIIAADPNQTIFKQGWYNRLTKLQAAMAECLPQ